jgi:hypothetical protein
MFDINLKSNTTEFDISLSQIKGILIKIGSIFILKPLLLKIDGSFIAAPVNVILK